MENKVLEKKIKQAEAEKQKIISKKKMLEVQEQGIDDVLKSLRTAQKDLQKLEQQRADIEKKIIGL